MSERAYLSFVVVIFRNNIVGHKDCHIHSSLVERQQLIAQSIICDLVRCQLQVCVCVCVCVRACVCVCVCVC